MDVHLTIPLWPFAAILSIVVAGLAANFVSFMAESGRPADHRTTLGEHVFIWVSAILVGAIIWGIWHAFGYPMTANVIAAVYALGCVWRLLRVTAEAWQQSGVAKQPRP
ncbi:hypothetical protein [Ralstonia pseudosolanacearum]|uniref:hypothetical protein n=1 Tax=Ralstonia pseudosolanacearum TaxID=1310165 RepID=UPI003CECFB05